MQQMTAERRRALASAGLRAYPNIARAWGLREREAARLLGTSESTYRRWKQNPDNAQADVNLLERLSLVLGIYKSLQILLPRPEAANDWVNRPNTHPRFAGRAPIERMRAGNVADLVVVREHLDGARG